MTKIDLLLYWYTLIFSLVLIVSAFGGGINLGNLTVLAFFLPVPTYLLLQAIKRYYLIRNQTDTVNLSSSYSHHSVFSFKHFLTQRHPLFIFSFVLLLTAWLISLIKSL